MLADLIRRGFREGKDLNCAESILYGANQAYELGLSEKCMKTSAGFGGGLGIEEVCGALSGSVMVLGILFVGERAHESNIYEIDEEFLEIFRERMGSINCTYLQDHYWSAEKGCDEIILEAAKVLDKVVEERS